MYLHFILLFLFSKVYRQDSSFQKVKNQMKLIKRKPDFAAFSNPSQRCIIAYHATCKFQNSS